MLTYSPTLQYSDKSYTSIYTPGVSAGVNQVVQALQYTCGRVALVVATYGAFFGTGETWSLGGIENIVVTFTLPPALFGHTDSAVWVLRAADYGDILHGEVFVTGHAFGSRTYYMSELVCN